MTTLPGQPTKFHIPVLNIRFKWQDFVQEHITRSWWLTGWLLVLTLFTVRFAYGRFLTAPISTITILILWAVTVILTVFSEITHRHTNLTRWLKDNLYSSITNIQVTLIIVLGILATLFGLYRYAWVNASFYTIPMTEMRAKVLSTTGGEHCFTIGRVDPAGDPFIILDGKPACFPTVAKTADSNLAVLEEAIETPLCFDTLPADPENGLTCFKRVSADIAIFEVAFTFSGANWGAVAANMPLMMVFRFDRNEIWRVWAVLVMVMVLFIPSQFVYRPQFPNQQLRRWLTYIWLGTPLVAYLLLRGVPAVPFETNGLGSILGGTFRTVFEWRPYTFYALESGTATILNGVLVVADPVTGEPARDSDGALIGNVPPLTRWLGALSLNRSLYGTAGTVLLGAALWLLQWFFPMAEREVEWLRIGRSLLRLLFGISAVLALLALLKIFTLFIGSITWPSLDGTTVGRPIFSELDPDVNWGGFLLTLIITVFAIVVSFPIGLVLALGRRSNIPGIPAWLTYAVALIAAIYLIYTTTPANLEAARNNFERVLAYWPLLLVITAVLFQRAFQGNVLSAFSTFYIEFVRGVPLIAVLFLATQLFPLLLPRNMEVINMWRVIWGITLFSAAYLAENVRGGLQAIPKGQYEAADSLGLGTFDKYRLIILPQAIRIVIPALVGQFIGLFKDTTLVAIVGLLDVLGVANAISAQPQWLGVRREAYLFLALLYFAGSAVMAGYSRRLEKRMGLGER